LLSCGRDKWERCRSIRDLGAERGNIVFSANHFLPNDPNNAWDGTVKGRAVNSAVFAYKLIAIFKDGSQEIRAGDVTLVR